MAGRRHNTEQGGSGAMPDRTRSAREVQPSNVKSLDSAAKWDDSGHESVNEESRRLQTYLREALQQNGEVLSTRLEALRQKDGAETKELVDALLATALSGMVNDPRSSLGFSNEALTIATRLDYTVGRVYALAFSGSALLMISSHRDALARLFEARRVLRAYRDDWCLAYVLSSIAGVHLSMGDYDEALSVGLDALEKARLQNDIELEGWLLHGLASGYHELGQYDRAIEYAEESLQRFERMALDIPGARSGSGRARALNALGTAYQAKGDFEAAIRYHDRCLELFRESGNRIGEARALNDIGVIREGQERLSEALDCHRQSLSIRKQVGNRQAQATSLINIARTLIKQRESGEAISVLAKALSLAEETDSKPRQYQAHYEIARAHSELGDERMALHHYQRFHEIREEVSGEQVRARVTAIQLATEVERTEQEAEIERLKNVELAEKNDQLRSLLDELKSTQEQLIQSEKMASLGQLTAGIAHEIKNPLNFVNNFAALTMELVDELVEVLAATDRTNSPEVVDLLADIRENADRIRAHGGRADTIVRNMLLHSRGRSTDRIPTDLNELADEYLNLAFHGMRAQDPDFNVELTREIEDGTLIVAVAPQEIGRVLLNLYGNAFYAVRERTRSESDSYQPRVVVRTRHEDGFARISIRDNGSGIPESMQKRIFEPFYSTKPAGSGTGLGLSISYDIVVRRHKGDLSVTSVENEFTEFVVSLKADNTTDTESNGPD